MTALETFWEQIAEILPFSVDSETAIKLYEKYQEAKQMEKEQIVKAHGRKIMRASKPNFKEMTGEEYYHLTYATRLQNKTN